MKRPWVRAGLLGPIPFLLPFVWVLEIGSCGGQVEEPRTGVSLLRNLEPDAWAVVASLLLLCVATPFIANRIARPALRFVTHVVGLLATALFAYVVWMVLFFAVFGTRVVRTGGIAVISLVALTCVDALLRVIQSARDWGAARRALLDRR